MVKAHQRRIVFGGEQAIVGIKLRLHLLSQRLGFAFIHANDADPPECAHRLTIEYRRGALWRSGVVAESQPESSTQTLNSALRKK